eukprot:5253784-Pyramimonas_sp.AAC.1
MYHETYETHATKSWCRVPVRRQRSMRLQAAAQEIHQKQCVHPQHRYGSSWEFVMRRLIASSRCFMACMC